MFYKLKINSLIIHNSFVDPVAKNATTENMVYELLLKSGKDLNSTIVAKDGFYAINQTELILVLEKANQELIDAVIASKPQKVIALDRLFKGNDQYISAWETMHNPNFNYGEFATIRQAAGSNAFKISVKELIEKTNATCIIAKAGRYGGTYAHKDIAFNFGMWISPVFQLYIVKEYQRLKEVESNQYNLEWNVKRVLSKVNYSIQTDAVKDYILPKSNYTKETEWLAYAEEADILNVALFKCTAKQWREDTFPLSV